MSTLNPVEFRYMNGTEELSPIAAFILSQLERIGWSRRRLSEVSGVSVASISRLLRGLATPETSTIEKIADALGVDRGYMLQLLARSQPNPVPEIELDREAANLARKISQLPPTRREPLMDALAAVFDSMISLEELIQLEAEAKRVAPDLYAEAEREIDEEDADGSED